MRRARQQLRPRRHDSRASYSYRLPVERQHWKRSIRMWRARQRHQVDLCSKRDHGILGWKFRQSKSEDMTSAWSLSFHEVWSLSNCVSMHRQTKRIIYVGIISGWDRKLTHPTPVSIHLPRSSLAWMCKQERQSIAFNRLITGVFHKTHKTDDFDTFSFKLAMIRLQVIVFIYLSITAYRGGREKYLHPQAAAA